jgi:hypothetical protein
MARSAMARRPAVVGLAAIALAGGTAALLGPTAGTASSHREAPLTATDPQIDNTDTYAFVSPDDPYSVTIVASWLPVQEPAGGPNFYPFADDSPHDVNIDNNGDGRADITYRWVFDSRFRNGNTFLYNTGVVTDINDPDLNFRQTYTFSVRENGEWKVLGRNLPVAPSRVGEASMPNYAKLFNQAVKRVPAGEITFAGQSDDPFFLDLRVFDLIYGADFSEIGNDTLSGYNVNTIALKVPKADLALNNNPRANPVIGVWSDTERRSVRVLSPTNGTGKPTYRGEHRQLSRLGMPLVNEVVIPVGQKDRFNASTPNNDAQFGSYVTDPELPKVIEALYGIDPPPTPRNDLVAVFLTGVDGLNATAMNRDVDQVTPSEMIRLNMSIAPSARPNRLGVLGGDTAGFPNGRRLADDVVDIELQVVEGELVGRPNDLGDAVNANDKPFQQRFPYVALPHSGSKAR